MAFAEPFQGYGMPVIIDRGGGYDAVLSGLDLIGVMPGRSIRDGEPIGTRRTTARLAASGATPVEPPTLYFELRKAGRPVNPAPWMRPPG